MANNAAVKTAIPEDGHFAIFNVVYGEKGEITHFTRTGIARIDPEFIGEYVESVIPALASPVPAS